MQYRYLILATILVMGSIVAIDVLIFDGWYVAGPLFSAAAYTWRGILYVADIALRTILYQLGWRRLLRTVSFVTLGGIGLTYFVTNPKQLRTVRGWKGRLLSYWLQFREWWARQKFVTKLAITLILIGAQLPFLLIPLLFPVGFLIAGTANVLRRIHLYLLDERLGGLYWQRLRAFNRTLVLFLRTIPGVSPVFDFIRSQRLSFRCGWRLWKYDPRFRDPFKTRRHHPIEGRLRLIKAWHQGEWRKYHGRPLLAGTQAWPKKVFKPRPWYAKDDTWYAPIVTTVILICMIAPFMDLVTGQEVVAGMFKDILAGLQK